LAILDKKELSNEQILRQVMNTLVDISVQNDKLFEVLLPYLIQIKKMGKDPNKSVKRRVFRVRHLISTLIIQGKNSKEFKDVNIHATGELLYGLIESSIFRISVLNQKEGEEIKKAIQVAIDGLLA
jgi:hypothetical protein